MGLNEFRRRSFQAYTQVLQLNKEELAIDYKQYGFTPDIVTDDPALEAARVTAVHRGRYALICPHGEAFGQLKTKEYYEGNEQFPTVGDFVLIQYNPAGDSRIVRTMPRRTFFSRREPSPIPQEQAIAANFDYVFIMQSMNQNFNVKRLERYLTLTWQSGAQPVILLTKSDLAEDPESFVEQAGAVAFGVPVLKVSTFKNEGLEALEPYLAPGKTIVFLGSSGVGKSTLVNRLVGAETMLTSAVREDDSRGRHTTTHRQLILLPGGAMLIDTPGMRELGMWDVSDGLGTSFSDVEAFLGQCRFADCQHDTEPGCRIKEALASGELSRERWESYLKLKKEAMYTDDKGAFLRHRQQHHKAIAIEARRMKKRKQ